MSTGRFTLQEKLNESATTTVYKAHHGTLGRTVLLKILHKHLAGDPALVERFTREARASALIRSEFIVQVYDLTEIDGAPAIVMEFVDGPSLKDVLAAEGSLSAERTLRIAFETLSALQAAHARGVIHRDIKPGNMLVAETGQIKVTDFGLASVSASQTVTMEGAVLGTPAYLPPEHIRGEAADERSDLFSLGATLLEVCTGRRIFEGPTYSACIHNILSFDVSVIDAMVENPRLSALIRQLMQPDRSKRFGSARDALDALASGGVLPEADKTASTMQQAPAAGALTGAVVRFPRVRPAMLATALMLAAVSIAVFWMLLRQGGAPQGISDRRTADTAVSDTVRPASRKPAHETTRTSADTSMPAQPPIHEPDASPLRSGVPAAAKGARDSASLTVTCIPWAKVFLDSQYLGETPIGGAVKIPSGIHTISFTNPQFVPIVRTVTAAPGSPVTAAANFFDTAGYILITVTPWAEVYIDDQYRDTTPIDKPLPATAGRRTIRLHNPGFIDAVYEITVPKKDTLRLSYSLTRNH